MREYQLYFASFCMIHGLLHWYAVFCFLFAYGCKSRNGGDRAPLVHVRACLHDIHGSNSCTPNTLSQPERSSEELQVGLVVEQSLTKMGQERVKVTHGHDPVATEAVERMVLTRVLLRG